MFRVGGVARSRSKTVSDVADTTVRYKYDNDKLSSVRKHIARGSLTFCLRDAVPATIKIRASGRGDPGDADGGARLRYR